MIKFIKLICNSTKFSKIFHALISCLKKELKELKDCEFVLDLGGGPNLPIQKHLSGWSFKKMRSLDYESRGLAGLKFLRQEVENESMGDDLTTSIRFWPRPFWFAVATLSQLITYFVPELAFELFSVKRK
ncbi:MAG TPA: hypothetical protein VMW04_01835 [Patescibacteria group bacterium]|nr:hypothetical protein [Patescibacteria group bacterium]